MLNEDGAPKMWYHSTSADFTTFKKGSGEPGSKRFHNLKYIEKVASVADGVLSENGGLTEATHATTYSVSDLYALVKRYDKDFKPKAVNPAMLNEDGAPKVWYHSTSADFTTFKKGSGELGTGYISPAIRRIFTVRTPKRYTYMPKIPFICEICRRAQRM